MADNIRVLKEDELVISHEFGNQPIPIKFKRLSDRRPGESWILLVYGPSKSGKTYFAGTCGPRTLYINIGDGLETLMSPAFTSRYSDSKGMITVDVGDHPDPFGFICETIDYALANFPNEFDTVVLDEVTALRRYAINKAIDLNNVERTRTRVSRTKEYVKADVQDFNIEMDMIEWFFGTYCPIFKKEGKNFLVLAHDRQVYGKPPRIGEEAPLIKIVPGFTGKTFPDKVPAYFDDVWRMEAVGGVNKVYRLRTAGDEKKAGGSRHGGIFKDTESDPNFLEMLNRIKTSHN